MSDGSAPKGVLVPKIEENDLETTILARSIENSEPQETTTTLNTSQEQNSEASRNSSLPESLIPNTIEPSLNSLKILQNSECGYIASQRELLRQGEEIERNSTGLTERNITPSEALGGSATSAALIAESSERESNESGSQSDSTPRISRKISDDKTPHNLMHRYAQGEKLNKQEKRKIQDIFSVLTRLKQGVPHKAIAVEFGLPERRICQWATQYGDFIDELDSVQDYKAIRADVMATVQSQILRSIPKKLEGAELPAVVRAFEAVGKYERLERGLSTDNKRLATTTVNLDGPTDDTDN